MKKKIGRTKTYPTNKEIACVLRNVAAAYTLKENNRFRIVAYERAADAVEHASIEMKDLWDDGTLKNIPGIGANIAGYLDEWFRTGEVKHFQEVMRGLPTSIFPLLDVSGFGPKRAYKLVTELNLTKPDVVVDELIEKGRKGMIASIEGFGEKSQDEIVKRLQEYKRGRAKSRRMTLPYAYQLAEKVLDYLRKNHYVLRAESLGSLRRMVATVGDVDIAVASEKPGKVINWFVSYKGTQRIIEKGPTTASIIVTGGNQIDLMVQSPASFGSLLQHFTGSKQHNIHLRELAIKENKSLSEYGIKDKKTGKLEKFETEEAFYQALGLQWIPPELRENKGEIEAAKNGNLLPSLISLKDIKGDLHIHSNYDLEPSHDLGNSSLKALLDKAGKLGYKYIGISDHNPSMKNHTNKQIIDIIKDRKDNFEEIIDSTKSVRVHLFIMLEIDILPDGKLALPNKAFNYLDAAIVSIHSSFNQSRKKITRRVLSGLSHPKAKIFAHPTGRTLFEREGIDLDWEQLFSFCKENDKALEINSWPQRLDLPDDLVFQAVKKGVKLVINTDSHHRDHLENIRYGVAVARRGWATAGDVLNTKSYTDFKRWLFKE